MHNRAVSPGTPSCFQYRSLVLALSFALWIGSLALALPALISPTPEYTLWGNYILLAGWLGFVGTEDFISLLGVLAWWANPFYIWALTKAALNANTPMVSANVALGLASLTVLVGRYAVNEVPVITPVIGYGPGAFLWYLAILSTAYVVARDGGDFSWSRLLFGFVCTVCFIFSVQLIWRAVAANTSERARLPFYSAKRGFICSIKADPLPIADPQPAIALDTDDTESKLWLESLNNWGVAAIQVGPIEYSAAPEGSPESQKSPYMAYHPVSAPARYTLRIEGGYPYVLPSVDGGDYVRMRLIDNQMKVQIGQLDHYKELNRSLGFCPSLSYFRDSLNEEAIRWLAPFLVRP